jgi:hypothetical protein
MHEPVGPAWLVAIEKSGLARVMRESLWTYPIVEIVHIVGFVILVGTVISFDLRLLGLSRSVEVKSLARHLLPWSVASILLVVPAGLLMFSAHATEFFAIASLALWLAIITCGRLLAYL